MTSKLHGLAIIGPTVDLIGSDRILQRTCNLVFTFAVSDSSKQIPNLEMGLCINCRDESKDRDDC